MTAQPLKLSYDASDIDMARVCTFIQASYWGSNLSKDQITQSCMNTPCVSIFLGTEQIGFARAVTDKVTCAHIKDFFITKAHRNQGHGQRLLHGLMAHPDLIAVQSWFLGTKDAQGFYAKAGFQRAPDGINMFRHTP